MTRTQQVIDLDHGQSAGEIAAALGTTREVVYQVRHKRKLRGHTRDASVGRASFAAEEVARHMAAGVERTDAFVLVAQAMGVRIHTVRNYCTLLDGRPRRSYAAKEDAKSRPRCACSLTLFSPEELASGTCNNCLPTSAVELLGRGTTTT